MNKNGIALRRAPPKPVEKPVSPRASRCKTTGEDADRLVPQRRAEATVSELCHPVRNRGLWMRLP